MDDYCPWPGEVDGDGDRWFTAKTDEYGDMQHMWDYLS